MISSPHLATTLLYNVSRRWSEYLNRCAAAPASKVMKAPGASVSFSLKPILVELEEGRYIGPILPVSLANIVAGRRSAFGGDPKSGGGSSNGGGGGINKKPLPKVDATRGPARVWARYDAQLPSLYLQDEDNSRSILEGDILPTLHGNILCKNCHLFGVCWEYCEHKN